MKITGRYDHIVIREYGGIVGYSINLTLKD